DERLRLVLVELVLGRLDEERLREQRMPRAVGDDADAEAVGRVGACEGVDDVEVVVLEVGDELVAQATELRLLERLVDAPPPDPALRSGLADDELVLRRAAGVAAGVDDERPALGKPALAAEEGVRIEEGGGRLPVDAAGRVDAVLFEAVRVVEAVTAFDTGRRRHPPPFSLGPKKDRGWCAAGAHPVGVGAYRSRRRSHPRRETRSG